MRKLDGEAVGEAVLDAVAEAGEMIADEDNPRLVGLQITTVWETDQGIRVMSKATDGMEK